PFVQYFVLNIFVKLQYNSYLYFFSSRRRHTRSKRDWSSDVCSSDLLRAGHISSAINPASQIHVGMAAIALFGVHSSAVLVMIQLNTPANRIVQGNGILTSPMLMRLP